jgi:hypothetical protein
MDESRAKLVNALASVPANEATRKDAAEIVTWVEETIKGKTADELAAIAVDIATVAEPSAEELVAVAADAAAVAELATQAQATADAAAEELIAEIDADKAKKARKRAARKERKIENRERRRVHELATITDAQDDFGNDERQ